MVNSVSRFFTFLVRSVVIIPVMFFLGWLAILFTPLILLLGFLATPFVKAYHYILKILPGRKILVNPNRGNSYPVSHDLEKSLFKTVNCGDCKSKACACVKEVDGKYVGIARVASDANISYLYESYGDSADEAAKALIGDVKTRRGLKNAYSKRLVQTKICNERVCPFSWRYKWVR